MPTREARGAADRPAIRTGRRTEPMRHGAQSARPHAPDHRRDLVSDQDERQLKRFIRTSPAAAPRNCCVPNCSSIPPTTPAARPARARPSSTRRGGWRMNCESCCPVGRAVGAEPGWLAAGLADRRGLKRAFARVGIGRLGGLQPAKTGSPLEQPEWLFLQRRHLLAQDQHRSPQ